jgi:RNA polymerase sigma factor (sigma-70 family)
MNKIRVLLVEDYTIVRKGLRSLLSKEEGIEVVGEAGNGREAVNKVQQLLPDIVLMDIGMQHLNGLEATRQIKRRFPDTKVLILTVYTNEEYIFQTLIAGASGYVVKKAAPEELVSAIKAVYQGESYLSPTISRKVVDDYIRRAETMVVQDSYEKLTEREREVLQLIAEGNTNREIAELLHVSVKTVETHRAHLMDKLGIFSTAGLTRYAIRKGVISLDH